MSRELPSLPGVPAAGSAEAPFGAWLKLRRKALDLTQEQLAACADLSLPTVAKIETGRRRPSRQVAELLARCLKVPAEQMPAFIQMARAQPGPAAPENRVSLPLPGVTLPAPLTRLIGRERELAELRALLGSARLLTLTGPGGVGKTRLAIALAWRALEDYPDGAHFVSLAPLAQPDLVLDAIGRALGLGASLEPLAAQLRSHLAGKRLLLVLDNFEHLLAAAPAVADLLAACRSLTILATSRECLRVRGERQFRVGPLALPDAEAAARPDALAAGASPAVALFVERARDVCPDFGPGEGEGRAIAAICAHFDGLPLAIELAATRMDVLTPSGLLDSLDRRLALPGDLAAVPADLPARQRTLRDAIRWSYDLLTPPEQTLFARLAVFAGGFTVSSAEAVCNARGDLPPMAEGLGSLLRKSLLTLAEPRRSSGGQSGQVPVSSTASTPSTPSTSSTSSTSSTPSAGSSRGGSVGHSASERRLDMLETIREYALERFAGDAAEPQVRRHHAEYCLALAEAASPDVLAGPDQAMWVQRLEEEHANIRAALAWSVAGGVPTAELGLRLSGALGRFWDMRGYAGEGRRWLQLALDNAGWEDPLPAERWEAIPAGVRSRALGAAGALAVCQGEYPAARDFHFRALSLARQAGDQKRTANCLMNLGNVANRLGEHTEARSLHEQALASLRAQGDQVGVARVLVNLGFGAFRRGDYAEARALYEESAALKRRLGDRYGIALVLGNLGEVATAEGNYARAGALASESLAMREEMGDQRGIAFCLASLGRVAAHECKPAEARAFFVRSLACYEKLGDRDGLAACLEGLGESDLRLGRPGLAVRLFGAASSLRSGEASSTPPGDRTRYEEAQALARSQLGPFGFDRAWAEGAALPLQKALALASSPHGLTSA